MRLTRLSIGLLIALALAAAVAAALTIWLLLSDPLRAVNVLQGNVAVLTQQLFEAAAGAVRAALDWL